ncbi:uncharacterized protein [Venturia canescens]|uniref:uncharacterized protein n=1 Tax=Venturia canescens TaxID=32260 RepID=UPI001C9C132A|nr:uncharacterized protein LOC122414697 [Venturia canescens]
MKKQRQPVETVDKENYYEKERPFITLKRQCGKAWNSLSQFLIDTRMCEAVEIVSQYLLSNPVLLAACIAIISAVAIPLLLFLLFAIVNVAFAFTSFIVIEVSVLTIGATVLGCMLFCVISVITIMGLSLVLTYYIAYYILSVIRSMKATTG